MEQPSFSNSNSTPQKPTTKKPNKQKVNFPTPEELITHYESQGMNTQQASVKVIDDLQHMLFRIVKGKKDNSMSEVSRKVDSVNARLALIEKKIDSKPGFVEIFGIGIGSVGVFSGVSAVWPQVVGGAVSVWNSVRGVSKT